MKIVDKTPYRSETGEIDLFGRIQGMLKYGMSWPDRLKAQDVIIAILEKQLDSNYALLRNVTLPNTEINLPLVLIGPAGIYLINVTYERGVYIARDDQWGTMMGSKFAPARINQVSRTMTFGRVLQLYLDRQGFKGSVVVESILMASDPGIQVESTRPAVRIVMSDALERFAASMSQARGVLEASVANQLVKAILVGLPPKPAASEPAAVALVDEDAVGSSYGAFSFDDQESEPAQDEQSPDQAGWVETPADDSQAAEPQRKAKKAASKKKGPLGMTTTQLMILGGMLLCSFCTMAAALIYVYFSFFANV